MKTMKNEQLERQISEKLDGRLDDVSTADLLRELMRDPDARATHDTWQKNDQDAAAALGALIDMPPQPYVIEPKPESTFPWKQALATAAAVVMAAGVWVLIDYVNGIDRTPIENGTVASNDDVEEPITAESIMAEPIETADTTRWWRTSASPVQDGRLVETVAATHVVDRQTEQNAMQVNDTSLLGVIDEQAGRTFWMEVRSDQTVIQAVGGEM